MGYYFWSSVANAAASFFVAAFVFLKDRRKNTNRVFIVFAVSVGLWASCYAVWIQSMDLGRPGHALFWIRLAMVGSTIIPPAFTEFVIFLLGFDRQKKTARLANLVVMAAVLLVSFSPLFIQSVSQRLGFQFWPVPGPLFYVFHVWFGANVVVSHILLLRWLLSHPRGVEWKRNLSVFIGTLIGFIGGMTNHFLWYQIPIPPVGNILVAVYVLTVAFSIVKYRLMDIEVIIKKTLVFTGIVGASVCVLALPLGLIQTMIGRAVGLSPFMLMILSAVTAVLIYDPVAQFLTQVTDRFLFQKKVNYQALLKEASQYLSRLDSVKRQARRIAAFLSVKARIVNTSVFVSTQDQVSFLLYARMPLGRQMSLTQIRQFHPIVQRFFHTRSPIHLERLLEERKEEADLKKRHHHDEIIVLLKALNAEAAIPCFASTPRPKSWKKQLQLRGMLFLGPQKSDEPYTPEDLDVFFTLGQESSIVFENARLYDEQFERARELAEINTKMTQIQGSLIQAVEEAERARKQAEAAKEEALAAKKRTEEMELELVRREKLIFVELLMKGLAHEIFNPMTPLRYHVVQIEDAYVELFLIFEKVRHAMDPEANQRCRAYIKAIKEGVEALRLGHDHIRNVIDTMTQIQRKVDETIKPFDLKTFCQLAHPLMGMETHGEALTDIPVSYDIERDLPLVLGNPTQLAQVFINFFRNALHAMNGLAEKKVIVTARLDPKNPEMIQILFRDSGRGIPRDVLPRIFDFQFTTKGEKGQGIGLNQCQLIIEKFFHGTLTCESEVGKGTTFKIGLPIWKGDKPSDQNLSRG